jgi:selenide,water dikinase
VLMALNLVAFPDTLPPDVVTAILRGGAEAVRAAGGVIAGGHSIVDPEPKYGLAVIGRAHPDHLFRKAGAEVGDVLVLTKPLGTGLITTALKRGLADAADLAAATTAMSTLNRVAAHAARAVGAHAVTDITGFGLAGHALEMADRSGRALRLAQESLPLLPNVSRYAELGCFPGGAERNRAAFASRVAGLSGVSELYQAILFDPQTSGGLLVALPPAAAEDLVVALAATGVDGRIIGDVIGGSGLVIAH